MIFYWMIQNYSEQKQIKYECHHRFNFISFHKVTYLVLWLLSIECPGYVISRFSTFLIKKESDREKFFFSYLSIAFIQPARQQVLFQLINMQQVVGTGNAIHTHSTQVHNFVNVSEINYLLHKIALSITTIHMCNVHQATISQWETDIRQQTTVAIYVLESWISLSWSVIRYFVLKIYFYSIRLKSRTIYLILEFIRSLDRFVRHKNTKTQKYIDLSLLLD